MGDRLDELPVVAGGFACAPPPGDDAVDSSAWDHGIIASCPRSGAAPCISGQRGGYRVAGHIFFVFA